MSNQNIRNLTRDELEAALLAAGEKKAHARRLFKLLHRERAADLSALPGLPEKLKAKLAARCSITPEPEIKKLVSKDGTVKLLLRFEDGAKAESVVIFANGRASACVSSQSGCACGCAFCATGALGLKRNLEPHEILAQFPPCLDAAGGRLDSLVFMGMGEPFLNWDNVKKSILLLSDSMGHHFSQGKMTVSTVGITPVIRELADSELKINLALSLITADAAQRAALAPMERKYPIAEIMAAAADYCAKRGKIVFLEYILFGGLNDSERDAEKLAALAAKLPCTVNLIPYNPSPGGAFSPVGAEKAREFKKILMSRGIRVYLRTEKGADINAACGQLAARL